MILWRCCADPQRVLSDGSIVHHACRSKLPAVPKCTAAQCCLRLARSCEMGLRSSQRATHFHAKGRLPDCCVHKASGIQLQVESAISSQRAVFDSVQVRKWHIGSTLSTYVCKPATWHLTVHVATSRWFIGISVQTLYHTLTTTPQAQALATLWAEKHSTGGFKIRWHLRHFNPCDSTIGSESACQ